MAKRILIVDDETDVLRLVKIRLEKSGYEVSAAANSLEAVAAIDGKPPDLILLDLLLPGERGEELCKRLKADVCLKHIPVVIFTASACDILEKLKAIGADDYIMKPFGSEELLEKIKRLTEK